MRRSTHPSLSALDLPTQLLLSFHWKKAKKTKRRILPKWKVPLLTPIFTSRRRAAAACWLVPAQRPRKTPGTEARACRVLPFRGVTAAGLCSACLCSKYSGAHRPSPAGDQALPAGAAALAHPGPGQPDAATGERQFLGALGEEAAVTACKEKSCDETPVLGPRGKARIAV